MIRIKSIGSGAMTPERAIKLTKEYNTILERNRSRIKNFIADARQYKYDGNDNMFKLMLYYIKDIRFENRIVRICFRKIMEQQ